ncbi:unnamed protein product [Mesocestoides corti]|uniref:Uncharacterized protein n=1 Tax=Mesocestoides corti TaxID=53468 RepID=A0A0R3UPK1_MESCO|nr:unnamed protein product [Mesocestoides corti]
MGRANWELDSLQRAHTHHYCVRRGCFSIYLVMLPSPPPTRPIPVPWPRARRVTFCLRTMSRQLPCLRPQLISLRTTLWRYSTAIGSADDPMVSGLGVATEGAHVHDCIRML